MRKIRTLICVFAAFCSSAYAVREANADLSTTLSFFRITNNNPEDVAAQLSADVDLSQTTLTFTFKNIGTTSSIITQAYWDNGAISPGTGPTYAAGIGNSSFTDIPTSPPNLPSGNNASPAFVEDFSAGRKKQGGPITGLTTARRGCLHLQEFPTRQPH